jgi:glycosyltransferase involved in cell wall biosynthesis
MSVYNGSQYLREAVESILNQTFADFEFIIIDDYSSDNTWQILLEYHAQDQRIRLLKNEENIGLTKSLNKGIKFAQGEYIARQDADDVSLPERFQKQILFLDINPDVVLVSSNYNYIDSEGSFIKSLKLDGNADLTAWYLLFYNRIGAHGLTMFRRKTVVDIGAYAENYRYSQDYELLSRLVAVGDIVVIPDMLQLYRRNHSDSISVKAKPDQEKLALTASQDNIKQLIGEELCLKEIEDLRNFWVYNFLAIEDVSTLNSNLSKIHKKFLCKRLSKHSNIFELKKQLNHSIGNQFISFINAFAAKSHLPFALGFIVKVSLITFNWHPSGILNWWIHKSAKIFPSLFKVLDLKTHS